MPEDSTWTIKWKQPAPPLEVSDQTTLDTELEKIVPNSILIQLLPMFLHAADSDPNDNQ